MSKYRVAKSPGTAVLLSCFFTGAGQLYAECDPVLGVFLLIGHFVLAISSLMTGFMFIVWLPYWIWGMIDAKDRVDIYNEEVERSRMREDAKGHRQEQTYNSDEISQPSSDPQYRQARRTHQQGANETQRTQSSALVRFAAQSDFVRTKPKPELSVNQNPKSSVNMSSSLFYDRLDKLARLRESGILTNDEFKDRKSDLIAKLDSNQDKEASEDFLVELIAFVEKGQLDEDDVSRIKKKILGEGHERQSG